MKQVITNGKNDPKGDITAISGFIGKPEFKNLKAMFTTFKKKRKLFLDSDLFKDLARDIFTERMPIPNYVTISDKYIIKIDKYIRMINQKYQLEKKGLSTHEFNDGELEIQESDLSDDGDSDIADEDLEDSDDELDPEKKKLKMRDRYMLQAYGKEA